MEQKGIRVYYGIGGSCDEAVERLLKDELNSNRENRCTCKCDEKR